MASKKQRQTTAMESAQEPAIGSPPPPMAAAETTTTAQPPQLTAWPCRCGVQFASLDKLLEHYKNVPDHAVAVTPAPPKKRATKMSVIADMLKGSDTVTIQQIIDRAKTELPNVIAASLMEDIRFYTSFGMAIGAIELTGQDSFRLVMVKK